MAKKEESICPGTSSLSYAKCTFKIKLHTYYNNVSNTKSR